MNINELIARLNSDGSILANMAANALIHQFNFIENQAYCPCCGGISHCMSYCTYSVTNRGQFNTIENARELLAKEYHDELDKLKFYETE